jgi:hypothetical protein
MPKSVTLPDKLVHMLDGIIKKDMFPQRWVIGAGLMMFNKLSHEEQVEWMRKAKSYSKEQ